MMFNYIDNNVYIYIASDYTDLALSTVTQRQSIAYTGTLQQLHYYLNQLSGDVHKVMLEKDKQALKVFQSITVVYEPKMVTIEVGTL